MLGPRPRRRLGGPEKRRPSERRAAASDRLALRTLRQLLLGGWQGRPGGGIWPLRTPGGSGLSPLGTNDVKPASFRSKSLENNWPGCRAPYCSIESEYVSEWIFSAGRYHEGMDFEQCLESHIKSTANKLALPTQDIEILQPLRCEKTICRLRRNWNFQHNTSRFIKCSIANRQ